LLALLYGSIEGIEGAHAYAYEAIQWRVVCAALSEPRQVQGLRDPHQLQLPRSRFLLASPLCAWPLAVGGMRRWVFFSGSVLRLGRDYDLHRCAEPHPEKRTLQPAHARRGNGFLGL